ncbi:MAG: chemotaxis protein CheX [Dehalococcoidia bacterium]
MKQEYINPFLSPAKLVWQRELGQPLNVESAEGTSHRFTTEDITAAIGVSGRLQGSVLYGFPAGTARAIIDKLLGRRVDLESEMALSALGEIANVITGNAVTELAVNGYLCDISPPIMIVPVGSLITTVVGQQILVTFGSPMGALKVRVSLFETPGWESGAGLPRQQPVQEALPRA